MKQKVALKVEGMNCTSCKAHIEDGLSELNGISSTRVDFAEKKAFVEFETDMINLHAVIKEIRKLGYVAKNKDDADYGKMKTKKKQSK